MTLNPKNIDLTWFFWRFLAAKEWITELQPMDLDRLRLPANGNCYRLSRVSWTLLKFLVTASTEHRIPLQSIVRTVQSASRLAEDASAITPTYTAEKPQGTNLIRNTASIVRYIASLYGQFTPTTPTRLNSTASKQWAVCAQQRDVTMLMTSSHRRPEIATLTSHDSWVLLSCVVGVNWPLAAHIGASSLDISCPARTWPSVDGSAWKRIDRNEWTNERTNERQ